MRYSPVCLICSPVFCLKGISSQLPPVMWIRRARASICAKYPTRVRVVPCCGAKVSSLVGARPVGRPAKRLRKTTNSHFVSLLPWAAAGGACLLAAGAVWAALSGVVFCCGAKRPAGVHGCTTARAHRASLHCPGLVGGAERRRRRFLGAVVDVGSLMKKFVWVRRRPTWSEPDLSEEDVDVASEEASSSRFMSALR